MKISKLTQENAVKISQWHYPAEYAFYDTDADAEDLHEILLPELRGTRFFQILTDEDELLGYFDYEPANQPGAYELSLGLAPEFTGHGAGLTVMRRIIEFVVDALQPTELWLNVAEFNVRAQKVYQKAGFTIFKRENQYDEQGTCYPFVWMKRAF